MSGISPIFPMPEPPQHFNDYGFNPQMDFFQVLGEARRQKREKTTSSIHFKLQKPIDSKRYSGHKKKKKNKWWKNAFTFFKWGRRNSDAFHHHRSSGEAGGTFRSPISSSPLYLAESRSTPYRSTTRKVEVEIPYLSLRELNIEPMSYRRMSTSTLPIYLVT